MASSIGVEAAAISALLGVIVTAGAQLRGYFKDRADEKNQKALTPTQRNNLIAEGAETVVDLLQQDYKRLHEDHIQLQDKHSDLSRKYDALEYEVLTLRRKVATLQADVSIINKTN
jgi:FtsZ-binding cell division protein ZapB